MSVRATQSAGVESDTNEWMWEAAEDDDPPEEDTQPVTYVAIEGVEPESMSEYEKAEIELDFADVLMELGFSFNDVRVVEPGEQTVIIERTNANE